MIVFNYDSFLAYFSGFGIGNRRCKTRTLWSSRAEMSCEPTHPHSQIKKIEGYLGTLLFERNNRNVKITSDGKKMAEQATVALDEARKIPLMLRQMASGRFKTLKTGVICLCCLSLSFLCLISFHCLSQAAQFKETPDEIKINTVEFLDQQSWFSLLKVSQEFKALIRPRVSAIRIRGSSAAEIIARLSSLLWEDGHPDVYEELKSLDLSNLNITEESFRNLEIFIHRYFPKIKSLNLARNRIGPSGAAHLAGLTQLKTLDLSSNRIGEAGAAHLARLTQLKTLDLTNNHIGDEGVAHLARLSQLKKLDLKSNNIGDEGVAHIAGLIQLQTLDLGSNHIGEAGAVHLARLTQLKTLGLILNQIGEAGVAHIAGLIQLQTLDLGSNNIGEAGAAHLKGLTQLKTLNLTYNDIGEAGAAHLVGFSQLKRLYLENNGISQASIVLLREALGASVEIH